ncbi:MAG: hypothetical protein GY861_19985 [bacterium]|nr:hypothetical protein [bacterium]
MSEHEWSNKKIKVIIYNGGGKDNGRTEWIATVDYQTGKSMWGESKNMNKGWCWVYNDWHTFNQRIAEKYTVGNFKPIFKSKKATQ